MYCTPCTIFNLQNIKLHCRLLRACICFFEQRKTSREPTAMNRFEVLSTLPISEALSIAPALLRNGDTCTDASSALLERLKIGMDEENDATKVEELSLSIDLLYITKQCPCRFYVV